MAVGFPHTPGMAVPASRLPPAMAATFRIDVCPLIPAVDQHLVHEAALLGLTHLKALYRSRYYVVRGQVDAASAEKLGRQLLGDPVTERVLMSPPPHAGRHLIEVQRKTGVMDPVEASIIKGAKDLGIQLDLVRVGTRVEVAGGSERDLQTLAWKALANQAIEEAVIDPSETVRLRDPGGVDTHQRTEVRIRDLDEVQTRQQSRSLVGVEGSLADLLE